MVFLKVFVGVLIILLSGLVLLLNIKDKKRDGPLDGIVKDSLVFQGYILAFALFVFGVGMIWSVF